MQSEVKWDNRELEAPMNRKRIARTSSQMLNTVSGNTIIDVAAQHPHDDKTGPIRKAKSKLTGMTVGCITLFNEFAS